MSIRKDVELLTLAMLAAIVLRLLVLTTAPQFVTVGDNPEFATLIREIIQNGFAVPATNHLYYPGSLWIYPPLILILEGILSSLLGIHGSGVFYLLTLTALTIDSLTVVPVFLVTKQLFGRNAAWLAVAVFVAFGPDIYDMTWSALPQITASALSLWLVYTLIAARDKRGGRLLVNGIVAGLLMSMIALSHDLSTFVIYFSVAIFVIVGTFMCIFKCKPADELLRLRSSSISGLVCLLVGLPAALYWYLPRIAWVLDTATATTADIPAPHITSALISVLESLAGSIYISLLFFGIFLFALYQVVRSETLRTNSLVITTFLLSSVILDIWKWNNQVLLPRLIYFGFLPALILIGFGMEQFRLLISGFGEGNSSHRLKRLLRAPSFSIGPVHVMRWPRFAALGILAAIIVANAAVSVTYGMESHVYYASCLSCPTPSTSLLAEPVLKWIGENVPANLTIASTGGYLGYLISALDGNPTIVYQPYEYLTQPSEIAESHAAFTLVYNATANPQETLALISEYHVSYVLAFNFANTTVPAFYSVVYSDSQVVLYRVLNTENPL